MADGADAVADWAAYLEPDERVAGDPETVADALGRRAERVRGRLRSEHVPAGVADVVPNLDPIVAEPKSYHPEQFPDSTAEGLAFRAGIASVVVTGAPDAVRAESIDATRTLVVHVAYDDRWEPPSGVQEAGETLAGTARRECREETGIEIELTGALYVRDYVVAFPEADLHLPLVTFAGRRVDGRRACPAHTVPTGEPEIDDVRWVAPEELPATLPERERVVRFLRSVDPA